MRDSIFLAAKLAAALYLLLTPLNASAQEPASPQDGTAPGKVLFVYDSSNSMWGELSDQSRKYEAGRSALASILGSGLADREIGFRAYGHRRAADCRDTELMVPFGQTDETKAQINTSVAGMTPKGKTPITYSLQEGLKDFEGAPGEILLISDGIETCDSDPCDLMREWRTADIKIRVHVVGVGLNELEREAMSCIAEESGGEYFDADSASEFETALSEASEAMENPADPKPIDAEKGYGIIITAKDSTGREYHGSGKLFFGGAEIGLVRTKGRGRNVVEKPGDYEVEVGPLLRDGSVYEPVRQTVTVAEPGDTRVEVLVEAPARVSATFTENGETHPGSFVTAFQEDKKSFGFRAFDEALARPGTYEFHAKPNDDNSLKVNATLITGETTVVAFELIQTIKNYIVYRLPNGDIIKRHGELWRDGENVYTVYSGNGVLAQPGVYELHSPDQNVPLTPTQIELKTDGETIEVPLDAGWVKIIFPPDDYNYVGNPDRAFLGSIERGNSSYARPDVLIPVAPGTYKVEGPTSRGFFETPEVTVASEQTVDVIMTPKPVGELVVTYAPSSNYLKAPDRASAYALDGQRIIGGILRPGDVRKFLPGRYRIDGWQYAGDVESQEITIDAGQRTEVVLKLRGE